MKIYHLHIILFLTAVFSSLNLSGQNLENQIIVKSLYDALQKNSKSYQEVGVLMPGINWKEIKVPEGVDIKNTITLVEMMKNNWGSILFKDLEFNSNGKNKIIVTGIVNGRRPTECEYISSRFKHNWSLNEGKIIDFSE